MKIEKLILETGRLAELKTFYRDILNLEVIDETSANFTVKVGRTHLMFKETSNSRDPFYHFAINIPQNKFQEAKTWIKERGAVLNVEKGDDEVFFESWNAHAIYFEDPAGNIVEFIARHNLDNGNEDEFTSNDLLNVSEIGIIKDQVIPFVRTLNNIGIPNWKDDSEGLTPVGSEDGLFIVVRSGRRWYFSMKDAEAYPVTVSIRDIGELNF